MANKGKGPDKMDTEKEAGTKRRYQSPQTPPQAPRSREHGSQQQSDRQIDGEDRGQDREGQQKERGTWQEHGQSQQTRGAEQTQSGRQGQQERQGEQQKRQDGQPRQNEADGRADGHWANRGADFDLQKASRDELNAIAMELNIDDYETMNREELVSEIRERS